MEETLSSKLYLVETRNFEGCYVSATHPTEAYEKLRKRLDKEDWGYEKDRELKKVTLVATQSLAGILYIP